MSAKTMRAQRFGEFSYLKSCRGRATDRALFAAMAEEMLNDGGAFPERVHVNTLGMRFMIDHYEPHRLLGRMGSRRDRVLGRHHFRSADLVPPRARDPRSSSAAPTRRGATQSPRCVTTPAGVASRASSAALRASRAWLEAFAAQDRVACVSQASRAPNDTGVP
jgi:hypothetical protein